MSEEKKRVVIVGAGFAGLAAAREFERLSRHLRNTEVVMLDRNNYHLFMPLLYQVGSGGIDPGNICFPMRAMFKGGASGPPVMFHECTVLDIDTDRKVVRTDRCDSEYDYLIFAPGSTTNYYGIPDLEDNTMPLKTIKDGMAMHRRVLESFETALLEPDEAMRSRLLTFVVVGGGATGVEVACTLAVFVFKTLKRDFPTLVSHVRVVVVEATNGLLGGMPSDVGRKALEQLTALGVQVMLNCRVERVDSSCIKMQDGDSISTCNIIWVAGVRPHPLTDKLPAEKARDGRIVVDEALQAKGLPGVYVIGDCGYKMQSGGSSAYPPTAQVAVREGKACARNITSSIMGRPQRAFDYKYRGELIFLGRNHAVGEFGGRVIDGFPAFWLYQTYYLNRLAGFKRKLTTAIDWAYDYFYRRNTAKLDC
ncbi:MAG: NAD(P)/FAD-dependent oxidoreductase [Dehalococcoidia bacterium]|nr:NAD(P)/FAD-dependent oxidoreductase [Dehalococcoidia bacterium]